jgi:hypothetical protein
VSSDKNTKIPKERNEGMERRNGNKERPKLSRADIKACSIRDIW